MTVAKLSFQKRLSIRILGKRKRKVSLVSFYGKVQVTLMHYGNELTFLIPESTLENKQRQFRLIKDPHDRWALVKVPVLVEGLSFSASLPAWSTLSKEETVPVPTNVTYGWYRDKVK